MANSETKFYDVVILGGGLAGMTCALQCRKESPDASILVLERSTHPVSEATHKVGESSVEVGAHYYVNVLGLKDHLEKDQLPKMGLRLFFDAGDNSRIDNRLEVGGTKFPPFPTFQFDRGRFENYLGEECLNRGIDYTHSAKVTDVEIRPGKQLHRITYRKDGEENEVGARWAVDATGRAGMLKKKFNLQQDCEHKASSSWIRINKRVKVDEWSDDEEWGAAYDDKENPRWLSTNHLLGEGYWIWMIPLVSGATSIGIVADEAIHPIAGFNSQEKFISWIEEKQPVLGKELRQNESLIMDFAALKQYSMECEQLYNKDRWAIVGDAGFFIDPFYSPGNDFIGLANTFACDLIKRDLNGKTNSFHLPFYNKLFRVFFNNTGLVFKENYQLFGNHQVMPVKIIWDWMIYWNVTGHIFIHDRLCRPGLFLKHMFHLKRLNDLNEAMQNHFRRWHAEKPSMETSGPIDTSALCVVMDTNRRMMDTIDDKEFSDRFVTNLAQFETIFWEIVDHSGMEIDCKIKRREHPGATKGAFDDVFRVSSGKDMMDPDKPSFNVEKSMPDKAIPA